MPAMLRDAEYSTPVTIAALGLDEAVCFSGPDLAEDSAVELIADDVESGFSYRFKARVAWSRPGDDGDGRVLGLTLEGVPLLVRHAR